MLVMFRLKLMKKEFHVVNKYTNDHYVAVYEYNERGELLKRSISGLVNFSKKYRISF